MGGGVRHGKLEMRREKDPKDSQFPTPRGALVALISAPNLPFKAPGRRRLFVNSFPALGPWAQPEGTPLCVSFKGHLRNKGSTPARCREQWLRKEPRHQRLEISGGIPSSVLEGEGAGPKEKSPDRGTQRKAEGLHEPKGPRVAVAPAQSRRLPRGGLSPERPRRSPPHCLQRSKNFATSRTVTNKFRTPFKKPTDN